MRTHWTLLVFLPIQRRRLGIYFVRNALYDLRDSANILADAVSKYDARDPTSLLDSTRRRISSDRKTFSDQSRSLRIGIPLDYNTAELEPNVRQSWSKTLEHLRILGHKLFAVSLPSTKQALSAYYILAPAEASSNLARYDGVRYGSRVAGSDGKGSTLYSATRDAGFGPEVKRRILLGSYTLSSEALNSHFMQAQRIRRLVQLDFDRVFRARNPLHSYPSGAAEDGDGKVDIIVCPTTPTVAPRLSMVRDLSPVQIYMADVFTVPASLAGLPAISIPVEQDNGVKGHIGIQVIGQFGSDELVMGVAELFENHGLSKAADI
jgi:aspartyl-tRNA(Asn)/glutamyl-tRNA(Gln) amidotransferase subunit A